MDIEQTSGFLADAIIGKIFSLTPALDGQSLLGHYVRHGEEIFGDTSARTAWGVSVLSQIGGARAKKRPVPPETVQSFKDQLKAGIAQELVGLSGNNKTYFQLHRDYTVEPQWFANVLENLAAEKDFDLISLMPDSHHIYKWSFVIHNDGLLFWGDSSYGPIMNADLRRLEYKGQPDLAYPYVDPNSLNFEGEPVLDIPYQYHFIPKENHRCSLEESNARGRENLASPRAAEFHSAAECQMWLAALEEQSACLNRLGINTSEVDPSVLCIPADAGYKSESVVISSPTAKRLRREVPWSGLINHDSIICQTSSCLLGSSNPLKFKIRNTGDRNITLTSVDALSVYQAPCAMQFGSRNDNLRFNQGEFVLRSVSVDWGSTKFMPLPASRIGNLKDKSRGEPFVPSRLRTQKPSVNIPG